MDTKRSLHQGARGGRSGRVLAAVVAVAVLIAGWQVFIRARSEGTLPPPKWTQLAAPAARPPVPFRDGEGNPVSLERFRNKVVLLNFWATWCRPCRKEMPALDRLQARLGASRFAVIALSADEGGADVVVRFYRTLGLATLGVYTDPQNAVSIAYGVRALPTTLLIDPRGREVASMLGAANWDAPEVESAIRALAQADQTRSAGQ